jgi:hypothetical protein
MTEVPVTKHVVDFIYVYFNLFKVHIGTQMTNEL